MKTILVYIEYTPKSGAYKSQELMTKSDALKMAAYLLKDEYTVTIKPAQP